MRFNVNSKITLLALAVSGMATSVVAEEAATADINETDIENILIIGEKAGRSLKDSTSSISVLTEKELNNTQYKSMSDALSEIANVVVPSGGLPNVRGVTGNGAAGGFNSISGGANGRVMTLIDGVAQPFVADLGGDTGLWDLEQVEIFRGPQSTSNGRNSIGGSVFIKTKDPSQEWEGAARLGYRNQDRYIDTAGVISGPLVEDTLAFRLSVQQLNADTITDSEEFETNPADYDLDEIKTTRIRGKLQWTPSDDLTVMLSHTFNNEEGDTGRVYYDMENLEDYKRIYFRDITTESSTTTLTANYEVSDTLSFDMLLSYMDYNWGYDSYEEYESDQQYLDFDEDNVTVDAKANFILSSGKIRGFAGLYYFERSQDILSTGAYLYNGDDSSESIALYGEVSFDLSDRVTLVSGARFEKQSQDRNFVYGAIDSDLDQDTNLFLPKLAITYDWTDNTTLAVSARQGYNAAGGALNFTAQEYYYYDDEKVNTYELSSRTQLDDGRGYVNANVFYNDYDGYQALSSTRFIVNMPKVVTYGAELEMHLNVTDYLELNAGVGLLESEISDPGDEYSEVKGNELNSAPNFNANVGAKYWLAEGFNVAASARYVGEYYGDFSNTEERIAGDYTLVRLNANYTTESWLFSAYIDNLFDETAFVSKEPASTVYPNGYASIQDPRNIGFSVTYQY